MLFNLPATDGLPIDLCAKVLGQIALLEDVVGEVGDPGMGGMACGVQGFDLDTLLHSWNRAAGAGVVVAEPNCGRQVRCNV